MEATNKVTCSLFEEYGLRPVIDSIFGGSPSLAVTDAFSDIIKVWEMLIIPKIYWNKETATESVKWLVKEKLAWDEDTISEIITVKTFEEFGLERMLKKCFDGAPYLAVKETFPDSNWNKLCYRFCRGMQLKS